MTLPQQSTTVGAAAGCGAGALVGGRDGCPVGALIGGVFGYLIGLGIERDLKAKADAYTSVRKQRAQLQRNIQQNAELIRDMKRYLNKRRREFDRLQAKVERGRASRSDLRAAIQNNMQVSESLHQAAQEALKEYRAYASKLSPRMRQKLNPARERLSAQLNELKDRTHENKLYYERLSVG